MKKDKLYTITLAGKKLTIGKDAVTYTKGGTSKQLLKAIKEISDKKIFYNPNLLDAE